MFVPETRRVRGPSIATAWHGLTTPAATFGFDSREANLNKIRSVRTAVM